MEKFNLNYEEMKKQFNNNEDMSENIDRLETFDNFHLLIKGSENIAKEISSKYNINSREYINWLSFCDGGLLFDTELFSSKEYTINEDLNISSTFDEINENRGEFGYNLPSDYTIIGLRSYGDLICISSKDDKVYLWDLEENVFSEVWHSFTDFMIEEIDTAIELIAEGVLEPIAYKSK